MNLQNLIYKQDKTGISKTLNTVYPVLAPQSQERSHIMSDAPNILPVFSPNQGGALNENLPFIPVNIALLTISDTRTLDNDTSGQVLANRIKTYGHNLIDRHLVRDDVDAIQTQVKKWAHATDIDVIICNGGTGLTGRDITPEALTPLFDKTIEGFSTIFHQVSFHSVGLSTLQSRACAGIINATFVFALPGSNGAVKDGWDKVIAAQLDSRHKPCNLVEIFPRLTEK